MKEDGLRQWRVFQKDSGHKEYEKRIMYMHDF